MLTTKELEQYRNEQRKKGKKILALVNLINSFSANRRQMGLTKKVLAKKAGVKVSDIKDLESCFIKSGDQLDLLISLLNSLGDFRLVIVPVSRTEKWETTHGVTTIHSNE